MKTHMHYLFYMHCIYKQVFNSLSQHT